MGKTVLADALGEGSEKTLAGGPVSPWKNVSVVASCLRVSGMLYVRVVYTASEVGERCAQRSAAVQDAITRRRVGRR